MVRHGRGHWGTAAVTARLPILGVVDGAGLDCGYRRERVHHLARGQLVAAMLFLDVWGSTPRSAVRNKPVHLCMVAARRRIGGWNSVCRNDPWASGTIFRIGDVRVDRCRFRPIHHRYVDDPWAGLAAQSEPLRSVEARARWMHDASGNPRDLRGLPDHRELWDGTCGNYFQQLSALELVWHICVKATTPWVEWREGQRVVAQGDKRRQGCGTSLEEPFQLRRCQRHRFRFHQPSKKLLVSGRK